MEFRLKTATICRLQGFGRILFASIAVVIACAGEVRAQRDATSTSPEPDSSTTPAAPLSGPNVPEGFMDVKFGTNFDDAKKLLSARNYRFEQRKDWQQIILKNVPIGGLNADEVTLSFSGDAGFYKGEAKIKVRCDKRKTQGNEAFDKISRTINSKYRKIPRVQEKLSKEKRSYWTTEWDFKTKDNKQTAYEIKLYMQDDWKSKGSDWQKTSNIFITYLAAWAAPAGPTPPEPPSEGL